MHAWQQREATELRTAIRHNLQERRNHMSVSENKEIVRRWFAETV